MSYTPAIRNKRSLRLLAASTQTASITNAAQTGLSMSGDKLTVMFDVMHLSLPTASTHVYGGKFDFSTNNEEYVCYIADSGGFQIRFRLENPAGLQDFVQWTYTPPTLVRQHFAFVWDGALTIATGSMKWYLDGIDQGAPGALTTNNITALKNGTSPFVIGAWGNFTQPANMRTQNWGVYAAALTAEQIAAVASRKLRGPVFSSSRGLWSFDGNADDVSGNGNTLTLNNSPLYGLGLGPGGY